CSTVCCYYSLYHYSSLFVFFFFLLLLRRLPKSTLFPYTTLFRSLSEKTMPSFPESGVYIFSPIAKFWHSETLTARTSRSARRCTDRKSTRLNSSHQIISYAVFCLKKKKKKQK